MKTNYIRQWFADWYSIFVHELKMIFSDEGVLVIFFLGGLIYPLLYNFIYHNGLLDEMPVAVVDNSAGSYSRRFVRKLDATRECAVAYDCINMPEAEKLMQEGKVHGIVYFPSDYDEKIVRMEQSPLCTYADMSSFLYYKCLTMGCNFVMLDELHEIQAEHYAAAGYDAEVAEELIAPVEIDESMPYNRSFSYTIFFISAALLLVIQQTLFYGSSLLAGTLREQNRSFVSMAEGLQDLGVGRVVLGRGAAYFTVYMVIGPLVALLIPWLFHLPQQAPWWEVMVLLTFFVVDCIVFSFTWSTLITRRETVFVLFLFMSPICIFLTGFSWPQTAIPGFWRVFSYLFPSTFGCRAFINLNTAGGTLAMIAPEITAMTIQTVVYYFLASAAIFVENKVLEHKEKIDALRDEINRRRGLKPIDA